MEAILRKEIITDKQLCRVIGISSFVLLTSLGAFVRIPLPFTPVPLTLQTLFVLLSGALLGGELGAVAQASYVFLGIIGLPVLAGSMGITFGYLFGFIISSLFLGVSFARPVNKFSRIFCLFCAADFILLACGALWLKIILGVDLATAFLIGVMPFVPGDILKILAACIIFIKLAPRCRKIF